MRVMDIFWIFLILVLLQPILRHKLLHSSRQRLINRIEHERGTRVIALIHRQETMSLLGFPIMRYVDMTDAEQVIRAIQMTPPERPIDLVLHTPGGLMMAALQIARAIDAHPGRVTVFVPHYAMSGGTLIALAADEIVMGPHAALGPVDPVIRNYPVSAVLYAAAQKPIGRVADETLMMAEQGRKAMDQIRTTVRELLAEKLPEDKADALARLLSEGHWTHDYPLAFKELKEWGLPVSDAFPELFYKLMNLFPQPLRSMESVAYGGPERERDVKTRL